MKSFLMILILSETMIHGMAANNNISSNSAQDTIIKIAHATVTDCFDDAVKEEFERTITSLSIDDHKELMRTFVADDDDGKRNFFKILADESTDEAIRKFFARCEEHDWVGICYIFELSGYPLVKPLSSRQTKKNKQDQAFTRNVSQLNWRRQRLIKQFGAMTPEVQKYVIELGILKNAHGNLRPDLEGLFDNEKKPLEEIFKYIGYEITIS